MKIASLETAKALQGLGYDGECTRWYNRDGMLKSANLVDDDTPAPRLDDAAYFLRDRYGVNISVSTDTCAGRKTECYMYRMDTWDEDEGWWWWTDVYAAKLDYEEALEAAVNKAIETIKNKQ